MPEIATQTRYLTEISNAARDDAIRLARDGRKVTDLRLIHEQAEKLRKDFVLRYGVIGDSNAGKSRLIGGLLGKASALPVNAIPFTGNIAVLRVRSDPALQSTVVGPYRLCFLSAEESGRCAAHLLKEFLDALGALSGCEEIVRTGRDLRWPVGQPIPTAALSSWLAQNWAAITRLGIDVSLRLTELARFVLAWGRLGSAVVKAREVVVTDKVAEGAMVLPKNATPASYSAFLAEFEAVLARAVGSGPLDSLPPVLTHAFACAAYPLVRDVRIEATVPAAVWDLRELHVEAIELYDFPGLGAQFTSARDAYLSEQAREQGHIHTWIIVVNSLELKGSQASKITKQLPTDRVIAVANRFDALPLWSDGHIQILDELIAPESPPRTQAALLNRLELLEPLTAPLGLATRTDRCVFISAMQGLDELDRSLPGRNILTADERKNWEADRKPEVRPKWAALAKKMRSAGDADAPLVGWLETYADARGQAGLVRLRRLLFEHANDVGLCQLAEEMRGHIAKLNDTIKAYLVRIDQQIEESQAAADFLRVQLTTLRDLFLEHSPPGNIDIVAVRPNGPTSNGQLPPAVRPQATAEGKKSLRDWVHDEVLMRVWDWPAWNLLFESVGQDGMVQYSDAKEDSGRKAGPWAAAGKKKATPPARVGELHGQFRQSYAQVEQVAVACLRSALMDFLTALSSSLAPLAADLKPLARTSPENAVNFALDLLGEQNLAHFFEPVACAAPADDPVAGFWRYRFPYLVYPDDNSGGLSAGPFLGWAPERRENVNCTRHQLYVARLRAEIGAALESGVVAQVAGQLAEFRSRFQELIDYLADAVKNLHALSNENLVALFGKGTGPQRTQTHLAIRHVEYPYSRPN